MYVQTSFLVCVAKPTPPLYEMERRFGVVCRAKMARRGGGDWEDAFCGVLAGMRGERGLSEGELDLAARKNLSFAVAHLFTFLLDRKPSHSSFATKILKPAANSLPGSLHCTSAFGHVSSTSPLHTPNTSCSFGFWESLLNSYKSVTFNSFESF